MGTGEGKNGGWAMWMMVIEAGGHGQKLRQRSSSLSSCKR